MPVVQRAAVPSPENAPERPVFLIDNTGNPNEFSGMKRQAEHAMTAAAQGAARAKGQEGEALGDLARGLGQFGDSMSQIAMAEKEKTDHASVMEDSAKLQDQLRELQFGENGWMNRQGANAVGLRKSASDEMQKIYGSFSEKYAPGSKARAAFDNIYNRARDGALDSVYRHETQATNQWRDTAGQAAITAATNSAIDAYQNPEIAGRSEKEILNTVRSLGAVKGLDPVSLKNAEDSAISAMHMGRARRALKDGMVTEEGIEKALKFIKDEVEPKLTGEDRIKLDALRAHPDQVVQDMKLVREATTAPGAAVRTAASVVSTVAPAGAAAPGAPDVVGKVDMRKAANVIWNKESSMGVNNVGAPVSSHGGARAGGIGQVMPATAREIDRNMIKDGSTNGKSDAEITQMLASNQELGAKYSLAYIRSLAQRYGSMDAVLVGYFAGPDEARKFITSGRDVSVLGPKTRAYLEDGLAKYGKLSGGGAGERGGEPGPRAAIGMGSLPAPGTRVTAANFDSLGLKTYKQADLMDADGGGFLDARAAKMADYVATKFFEETGIRVKVNEGGPATQGNRRGATQKGGHVGDSRHYHGDGFDFQIQSLTPQQKARFLELGRQAGFGGVGFYGTDGSGHLHLDAGRARSWGKQPSWAAQAMTLAQPSMAVPSSIGGLPVPASMQLQAGGGPGVPTRAVVKGTSLTSRYGLNLPPGMQMDAQRQELFSVSAALGGTNPIVPAASDRGYEGPAVPPPVSLRLDANRIDADAARAYVNGIADPLQRARVSAKVEAQIGLQERGIKDQVKLAVQELNRMALNGQDPDKADPGLIDTLTQHSPQSLIAARQRYERMNKADGPEEPKDDAKTILFLEDVKARDPDRFRDLDLGEYEGKLSRASLRHYAQQKGDLIKEQRQGTGAEGLQTVTQAKEAGLMAAGIDPSPKAAADIQRLGMFHRAVNREIELYNQQNKKGPTGRDLQEIIDRQLQPVEGAGLGFGRRRLLFEMGTPEDNAARKQTGEKYIGDLERFSGASSIRDIPTTDLGVLSRNWREEKGAMISEQGAVQLYNDALAVLRTGRSFAPPGNDFGQAIRGDIIAELRSAGIANPTAAQIEKGYAAYLKTLFNPNRAAPTEPRRPAPAAAPAPSTTQAVPNPFSGSGGVDVPARPVDTGSPAIFPAFGGT